MNRIVCLRIPGAVLASRFRAHPEWAGTPVVLLDQRDLVLGCSRASRDQGIVVGATRKQAQAICEEARFVTVDPEEDRAEWERLALLLGRFSPHVEIAGDGLFYLNAQGMGRLYGLPREYLAEILLTLQDEQYHARTALAGSRFAAYAATHIESLHVVAPGEDARALAPLPIGVLPLSAHLHDACRNLGIHTLGALASLPVSQLEARFGREGVAAARLAQGDDPTPLRPFRPVGSAIYSLELDGGLEHSEGILLAVEQVARGFCDQLAAQGLDCSEARLYLRLEDRSELTLPLAPATGTASARIWTEAIRLSLEAMTLPAPILVFRLEAVVTAPSEALQKPMFETQRNPGHSDRAALALLKLRQLLGDEGVLVPRRVATYRPEARIAWTPYGKEQDIRTSQSPPAQTPPPTRQPEGMRLCQPPLPLDVRVGEDGRPAWAQCAWVWGDIVHCQGPERLLGEWWNEAYARDYYHVDWRGGERAWIYYDAAQKTWFLQGIYD